MRAKLAGTLLCLGEPTNIGKAGLGGWQGELTCQWAKLVAKVGEEDESANGPSWLGLGCARRHRL